MTRFEELTHRVRNAVRQKREAENSSSSIGVKVTVELDSQLLTSCPADLENLPAKTSYQPKNWHAVMRRGAQHT